MVRIALIVLLALIVRIALMVLLALMVRIALMVLLALTVLLALMTLLAVNLEALTGALDCGWLLVVFAGELLLIKDFLVIAMS